MADLTPNTFPINAAPSVQAKVLERHVRLVPDWVRRCHARSPFQLRVIRDVVEDIGQGFHEPKRRNVPNNGADLYGQAHTVQTSARIQTFGGRDKPSTSKAQFLTAKSDRKRAMIR